VAEGPLVSTVILHWGDARVTQECVRSVLDSSHQNLDVVVVDNCPSSRAWNSPSEVARGVVYLQAQTNTGYCAGNNLGIRRAMQSEPAYILLLNNDTIVDRDLIRLCVEFLEIRSDVAVVTPKIYFYHRPDFINLAGGALDINTGEIVFFGGNQRDSAQFDTAREVTFATGCALFARSRALVQVGFFDEDLFCYGEDVDLSRRLLLAGMHVFYLPQARVWHRCASMSVDENLGLHTLPSPSTTYYLWRNRLHNLRRFAAAQRTRRYSRYVAAFLRKFASFALRHRRPRLCLAMILGARDAIAGRMGKRDYSVFDAPSTKGDLTDSRVSSGVGS